VATVSSLSHARRAVASKKEVTTVIWMFFLGVFVGAVFVSMFDWATNLRNEERRERWK
jgi:uncharacterized membrane protein YfcA